MSTAARRLRRSIKAQAKAQAQAKANQRAVEERERTEAIKAADKVSGALALATLIGVAGGTTLFPGYRLRDRRRSPARRSDGYGVNGTSGPPGP